MKTPDKDSFVGKMLIAIAAPLAAKAVVTASDWTKKKIDDFMVRRKEKLIGKNVGEEDEFDGYEQLSLESEGA
jgi:hypothetical protein